jgi:hypothetical protein
LFEELGPGMSGRSHLGGCNGMSIEPGRMSGSLVRSHPFFLQFRRKETRRAEWFSYESVEMLPSGAFQPPIKGVEVTKPRCRSSEQRILLRHRYLVDAELIDSAVEVSATWSQIVAWRKNVTLRARSAKRKSGVPFCALATS